MIFAFLLLQNSQAGPTVVDMAHTNEPNLGDAPGITMLPRGTRISFERGGRTVIGYVGQRHLDPMRKPGVKRVSYDVAVEVEVDGKFVRSGCFVQVQAIKILDVLAVAS